MIKPTLVACLILAGSFAFASPSFQSREGLVLGQTTAHGTAVFANVPFAQPPVGALRWRAPRPPLARANAWDGSRLNVKCAQVSSYFSGLSHSSEFGKPTGSEDCLYLNIWKPTHAKSSATRPVFVWFHGGSNRQGYASDPLYDGEALAAATDAIVVTVNYRLGAFGALYHDALKTNDRADSSGNYVTLDMIQALKWIHENAASLGADVDRLTVGGQSAGCMNVWGLVQSPLAKGLFTQAYCSSGFPNNYPASVAHDAADDVIKKALVLKNRAPDLEKASSVLKSMSADEIKTFLYALSTNEILSLASSFLPVQHVADGYVLPSTGVLALMTGSYNAVPMMVNSTSAEGSFFFLQPFSGVSKRDFWSILVGQASTKPIDDLIHSPLQSAKFENESSNFSYAMNQLIDSVLAYRQVRSGAIYRMRFEWTPRQEPWRAALGACHGIDLPFFFRITDMGSSHFFSFLNAELKEPATLHLSEQFLTYFKGYLHTGDPNAYAANQDLPRWSSWNTLLPNNLTFSRDEISSKYHYVNPLVGTYSLMTSIIDLQKAASQSAD